jgi:hypothetical protein
LTDYPYPVSQLLTLDEPEGFTPDEWPNYLDLGLTAEHIPDLIRLATDQELRWAEEDTPDVWGPIHAWRALGQLHAEAAAEPLLSLFERLDEDEYFDEWAVEELPEVYAMFGPAAIPALNAYLTDPIHGVYPRDAAGTSLQAIGKAYPEARADCVAHIMRILESFEDNDPILNANLISNLLHLEASQTLPLIEQAFDAQRVDESWIDWADVQRHLKLAGYRDDLLQQREAEPAPALVDEKAKLKAQAQAQVKAKAKAKAKRKQAANWRKKNRKRK